MTLLEQALTYHRQGNLKQAQASYEALLSQEPQHADALHFLGVLYGQAEDCTRALDLINQAIALNTQSVNYYFNRALIYLKLNDTAQALADFQTVTTQHPSYAEAYYQQGLIWYNRQDWTKARACFEQTLTLNPQHNGALNGYGLVLQAEQEHTLALSYFDQALRLQPNDADLHFNRGIALNALERFEEAVESYQQALRLRPNFYKVYNNLGNTFTKLKQFEQAIANYHHAIALDPNFVESYLNLGIALQIDEQYEAALSNYQKAVALKPDYAQAYFAQGDLQQKLRQCDEALASYNQAIALKPDYADVYLNRGLLLAEAKHFDAAIADYDQAIFYKPNNPEAYNNKGSTLRVCNRLEEAVESYEKALSLMDDYGFFFGFLMHVKASLCDWHTRESDVMLLQAKLTQRKKVSSPFATLIFLDDPALQKNVAEAYVDTHCTAESLGDFSPPSVPKRKIKLAYFSADFKAHPVAYLTAEMFEKHDREAFEVIGFYLGLPSEDVMHQRLRLAFDQFIETRYLSDKAVAEYARELGVDIAIDLGGYTQDSRSNIFAYRTAPIQVNYLGYPATMGASFMDYIFADNIIIPQEAQKHYSEQVLYLPVYQPNDSTRTGQDPVSKADCGLPETGIVFCCFNKLHKITPQVFSSWMRILMAVDGSVLWLVVGHDSAMNNLRNTAQALGLDPARLIFAPILPRIEQHMTRYQLADLFLDTLPYNAHTTASDALRMGLPLITRIGESFPSRVAASLLHTIGIPELITHSAEEYEALAIRLAQDTHALAQLKDKLQQQLKTTPLFNTAIFMQGLEAGYRAMYQRYQQGLKPCTMNIE